MDLGRTMTKKIETVVTKQRKTFKDYVHLTITEGPQVYILNVIKGRLYPNKKTMNPTYEPHPAKQEAVDRLNALADELRAKGWPRISRKYWLPACRRSTMWKIRSRITGSLSRSFRNATVSGSATNIHKQRLSTAAA
ncbi:hypothetical protein [Paenibacillus elgii]|uniref:hypothetical protein n=1 Tax=Paenibacillus elgii TaxID=189691 RepID=UPI001EF96514|nr:hypothetical protein [Paenibacillus elgii]